MVNSAYDITYTSSTFQTPLGYNVYLLDSYMKRVTVYPVVLYNEFDVLLGVVENISELIRMWNNDEQNKTVGHIELNGESTVAYMVKNYGATQRGFIRVNAFGANNFLQTEDGKFLLPEDGQFFEV